LKNGEFVVLNVCERIGDRLPIDFSIFVAWRIVDFVVSGEALAWHNFEIGGLPFSSYPYALFNFHNFTQWPYFSPICYSWLVYGV
jgi:hypothetical protein